VGSDGGITLVRARIVRAILTCTTCRSVVAVGPPVTGDEAHAAYLLGATQGVAPLARHMGICAGGVLTITFEQQPFPAPPEGGARHLRIVPR
jgi:hypothetical protein